MCKQAAALCVLIQKIICASYKSADFFASHNSEFCFFFFFFFFFFRTNVPLNVFPALNDKVSYFKTIAGRLLDALEF